MDSRKPAKQKTAPQKKDDAAEAAQEDINISAGAVFDARIFISVEKISPGSGLELLNMAKSEQDHRHSLEAQLVSADIENMRKEYGEIKRGQWFAFLTTLCTLGVSACLIMNNYSVEGSILGSTALALIVVSFVRSGRQPKS